VKGATQAFGNLLYYYYVSIHAPVKGATWAARAAQLKAKSFNPRAREGRDLTVGLRAGLNAQVSIHAPVKGATSCSIVHGELGLRVSIHAPVKGAT